MVRLRVTLLLIAALFSLPALAQTAATGALVGTVTDPRGSVLPGANVMLVHQGTRTRRTAVTDAAGVYRFPLIPPGKYSAEFSVPPFATVKTSDIVVNVSETTTVNATMQIGTRQEVIEVEGDAVQVQQETSSLSGLIGEQELANIPLTNRNYTQMLHLSAGVTASLTNAAQVGRNTQDVYVHGGSLLDNNYQMDGTEINNIVSNRAGDTSAFGGIPVPNPDAIQEFNIQTGQYDAGSGRSLGANVNVVTKSGTNSFHGSVFEYFRNDVLNANDFFLNRNGQPRPSMKQNQFGCTFGGPIKKNKLFFFSSYQGTRQINGMGVDSLRSITLPPLTNDRSASALGALFAGQQGAYQMLIGAQLARMGLIPPGAGPRILPDGSNINPVALALLQYKLPNGSYYIPTPQRIVTVQGLPTGMSTYSVPSHFNEDQIIENIDYAISPKHMFSAHWFSGWDDEKLGFPAATIIEGTNAVPRNGPTNNFRNYTLTAKLTSTLTKSLVNELRFSFVRNVAFTHGGSPLKAAQVGMQSAPLTTELPEILMPGMFSLGADLNDGEATIPEDFQYSDQVAWSKGKHNLRAGFSLERVRQWDDMGGLNKGFFIVPTFADFLLGLPGCAPGTFPMTCNPMLPGATTGIPLSNLLVSVSFSGNAVRHRRLNDWATFVQDDIKLHPQFTLNLGLRWEIHGNPSEINGLMTNFDPTVATSLPSAGGTYTGWVVASNFPGSLPPGVVRNNNKTLYRTGAPLHDFGPRVGFAWRPLASSQNFVVHAGYGIFYSRSSTVGALSGDMGQPDYVLMQLGGPADALASLQRPYNPPPPPLSAFPIWTPRTATSDMSDLVVSSHSRSPMSQQWSLNFQYELKGGVVLQAGYVGSHGTRLLDLNEFNQARLASAQRPINGQTTNTLENVGMRVPIVGFTPDGLRGEENEGSNTYHGLEVTVRKTLSHGLQLQATYTFSKTLNDFMATSAAISSVNGGATQRIVNNGRGVSEFSRPQRIVLAYVYSFPNFHGGTGTSGKLLGGWELSGVTTFQSGNPLTLVDSLAGSIYGANNTTLWYQPANFCPGSGNSNLVTSGGVESRLNSYINRAAICPAPVIGDGTGYGDIGRGALRGPGQNNWDIALGKITKLTWPTEPANLEIRAQFFNAFNHPQFANPGLDVSAPGSFGVISATSVSPRLIQFALKLNF